ncbi:RmlC-like cupin [Saitoella complicata NRRL Y-17804]|uniref:Cupin type-1 domain-containing protein n=1 Tax=Saitoella complicata (strain BCRC 22490 / CBS 7301 / JCM 7358 / NBRC 10748 / NRRL Y-17804) TaxID=698492 RepID=A0A0E9N9P2_SAICN|nr:RmlC-like cupin [Saitoella complicata NRRL Y-17804]ODQ56480.1 RmlC-like cupin [Saitoella complicata NRRL Y-17804]GAO46544.1 hypothetical protein G7K_0774-t1 [Saitoella complicata NRRL Y-17804]
MAPLTRIISLLALAVAAVPSLAAPAAGGNTSAEIVALETAATAVDRINILGDDSDFVFNFLDPNQPAAKGDGGSIVRANRKNFPALIDNGISMAVGFIGPCGFNTPHIHPRSSELSYSVNGTFLTGIFPENGARLVMNNITGGEATIIPAGSMHFQANLGCETVQFVSGFPSEDPGALQIAQGLAMFEDDILLATFGLSAEDTYALEALKAGIPATVALGLQECRARCGLNPPPSYSMSSSSSAPPSAASTGHSDY